MSTATVRAAPLLWLALSLLVILLDQLTKWWAEAALMPYRPEPLLPMFNLTLMYNSGAAFSFLADAGGWQRWFFVLLALTVSGVLAAWLWRLPRGHRWLAAGLSLLLGGALGNVIDRIRFGHVVDFIDVYYREWHWPAFNLADSAIAVGAALLIVDALFFEKRRRAP